MAFIYGPPVTGKDFVNRDKEIFRLFQEIEARSKSPCEQPHIEISAPRRIGKSSLLKELQRRLETKGYTPVYVDLTDIVEVNEFFDRLRNAVLKSVPMHASVKERVFSTIKSIRVDPTKTKGSLDKEGNLSVDFDDIVSMYKGTWKECGINTFKLLKRYRKLNFVLFLDEMGFVRKLKSDDKTRAEFLSYMDSELSDPDTPTTILCGSQNFFHVLRDIKPETYLLWRRKFLREPIGCFDENATINSLLIPNLENETVFKKTELLRKNIRGLSRFIYCITNGYPSVTQILGKEIVLELEYHLAKKGSLSLAEFKNIIINHVFRENIQKDRQGIMNELLSEEALGNMHKKYKALIYELYFNQNLKLSELETSFDEFELDELLRDLQELQYINLEGNEYTINYPFLKYYIWHPRNDQKTMEEIDSIWNRLIEEE